MYILKTFDKFQLEITDQEAVQVAEAMNNGTAKTINIKGNVLAISSISALIKEESLREGSEQDHKLGVLHDGTRVIRQFGEWMCQDDNLDASGRYTTRPDPRYYPEVALDTIPSVEDYQKRFKCLSLDERKALMIGDKEIGRYSQSNGLTKIGDIPTPEQIETSVDSLWCEKHHAFKVDCSCDEPEFEEEPIDLSNREV